MEHGLRPTNEQQWLGSEGDDVLITLIVQDPECAFLSPESSCASRNLTHKPWIYLKFKQNMAWEPQMNNNNLEAKAMLHLPHLCAGSRMWISVSAKADAQVEP
jgi:hypothetical protein